MQFTETRVFATTPVGGDAHLDVPLSNLAVSAFDETAEGMIGQMVFPSVNVGKQSDKYYIIDKNEFLRVPETLRAPKTKARKIEFKVASDSYFADNHALAGENALEELANADTAIMLRENTTRLVVNALRRAQEVRIANIVTSASNLGSGTALSGANKWSDYAGSDPVADVTTGHAYIRQNTGMKANTLIIDYDTLQVVRRHPRMLDLYKYTRGGELSDDEIRKSFRISRMLVGDGIKANQLENFDSETASMTNIWGNNAILAHITDRPTGRTTATLGLRFDWRPAGLLTNFATGRATFQGPGTNNVEVIETGHFTDEKIVASELGYAITGTL